LGHSIDKLQLCCEAAKSVYTTICFLLLMNAHIINNEGCQLRAI